MSNFKQPLTYPTVGKSDQIELITELRSQTLIEPWKTRISEETRAWVEVQNQVTFNYLKEIPAREKIKQRLTKLWNYEKYGTPFKEG